MNFRVLWARLTVTSTSASSETKSTVLKAVEQYVHNVQKGQKDLLAMAGAHNGLAPGDGMSRGLHHH